MLFYSSKIFVALSSSALILANGAIGSVKAVEKFIANSADTVIAVDTSTPDSKETGNTTPKESKTNSIGTESTKKIPTPTPEPTPTPTPTPAQRNSTVNQPAVNNATTQNQSSNNTQPAPQQSSSGTQMFYFSSYGDDAGATFNACVAAANSHGTANCEVTADDSGYLLTYSD